MEKWLFVVRSNVVNELREDEFNEWYNNVHAPDVVGIPGVLNVKRFWNPDWSSQEQGRYLAIYEVETDDIEKTKELMHKKLLEWFKEGRVSDSIVVVNLSFYKELYSLSK